MVLWIVLLTDSWDIPSSSALHGSIFHWPCSGELCKPWSPGLLDCSDLLVSWLPSKYSCNCVTAYCGTLAFKANFEENTWNNKLVTLLVKWLNPRGNTVSIRAGSLHTSLTHTGEMALETYYQAMIWHDSHK